MMQKKLSGENAELGNIFDASGEQFDIIEINVCCLYIAR